MRGYVTSGALAALLISGCGTLPPVMTTAAPAPGAPAPSVQPAADSGGFCRQPAALPLLPPEATAQARQERAKGDARALRGGRDVISSAPVMAAPPPPPPPPVMAPPAASEGAAVIVTGSRVGGPTSPRTPPLAGVRPDRGGPAIVPRPGPPPGPAPRAGLLTAGEHDDLLNPELYAAYVQRINADQRIPAMPRVDSERMLTVEVKDAGGQPMAFARVVVTCSDGNRLSLLTKADGRAVFFPGLDRLSPRVAVSASLAGRTIAPPRAVMVTRAPGGQVIGLTASAAAARPAKLDLMFVVDTTGSMGDELRYLQAELGAIIDGVRRRHGQLDVRLGLVFYRDEGDDYVTLTHKLSHDLDGGQQLLAAQGAGGGGDYPEALDQGLIRAIDQNWRPDAVKSLFLLADAPPHDRNFRRTWSAAEAARARNIHINSIAGSGVGEAAEHVMRAMAAATQARYLFLTDDSGIGNPHAPPAVACYHVTRLDALVRRVIDAQLSGRRVEPAEQEIIRTVGDYDAGKCRLPPDWNQQG